MHWSQHLKPRKVLRVPSGDLHQEHCTKTEEARRECTYTKVSMFSVMSVLFIGNCMWDLAMHAVFPYVRVTACKTWSCTFCCCHTGNNTSSHAAPLSPSVAKDGACKFWESHIVVRSYESCNSFFPQSENTLVIKPHVYTVFFAQTQWWSTRVSLFTVPQFCVLCSVFCVLFPSSYSSPSMEPEAEQEELLGLIKPNSDHDLTVMYICHVQSVQAWSLRLSKREPLSLLKPIPTYFRGIYFSDHDLDVLLMF